MKQNSRSRIRNSLTTRTGPVSIRRIYSLILDLPHPQKTAHRAATVVQSMNEVFWSASKFSNSAS